MNKILGEKELRALVEMRKDFVVPIKEQSKKDRKIAIKCEKAIKKTKDLKIFE